MVGVTTIKEIPKVWDGITLAAATKKQIKKKKKKKKKNTNFGTDCLRNIVFAKVTATDMTVITNLSFYDRKDFLFRQHYSFIFHPVYMYVRYRSMTLSDTCSIRRSWTLHAVPGLPVVAWGKRGNILLAHYDRDSCEKSAWKYRGNIVRWTWILQRFNEERNPFLVRGKTWLIITFRCVYWQCSYGLNALNAICY